MPRLYISAAQKSSGKTTLSIGLCRALTRRGLVVQPFKKGPDYIDPLWLTAAARQTCYNLDFNTQSGTEIDTLFDTAAPRETLRLIEGNLGLFDGLDVAGSDSNAAMAVRLDTPVILVLNTQGLSRGIAPLVRGFADFDPDVRIAGVILNKVASIRHESKLRASLERYTDIPVLGAVHRAPDLAIIERHLGLVPAVESPDAEKRIDAIADMVESQIDLDLVLALAAQAPPRASVAAPKAASTGAPVRIAVARDSAFCFYYPDDLMALERAGAELEFFSPLHDAILPEADGLFLGGGFPETHHQALAANGDLRHAIQTAIENGLPAYAECGGLMYLSRSLTWQDSTAAMAGVLPADVVLHRRPQGLGYSKLSETADHPWPSVGGSGGPGFGFAAHEFHYSTLENKADYLTFAYKVLRGTGIDGAHDGIVWRNLLASYTHLRDTAAHAWADRFAAFIRAKKVT